MVMRVVYLILQSVLLILAGPLLLVKAALTAKYRGRITGRLGFGLRRELEVLRGVSCPRIWIHALSLGEVASAQGLVRALRHDLPGVGLIFSAATASGEAFARSHMASSVDCFVPFPLDLPVSVNRLLNLVRPDLFVLVETDFWPNFLHALRQRAIPALLVNGRISDSSWRWYQHGHWLFAPLFRSFAMLAMQSEADARRMVRLGVAADRVLVLGNLKFDNALAGVGEVLDRRQLGIAPGNRVWVAGSTHEGEEEIVLRVLQRLLPRYPDLCLVVAPRQVERGAAVAAMARERDLGVWQRSLGAQASGRVLVLDTLGELARVYGLAEVAFVGGSLVAARGHNPLEPAGFGKPVLFGPHMEDFDEVATTLLRDGGARQVGNEEELFQVMDHWLGEPAAARQAGAHGRRLVEAGRGTVAARHVAVIRQLLQGGERHGPVA